MNRRIVITGIGLVTSVGSGVRKFWHGLVAGRSGIGPITRFDTTGCAVHIGGEVKDLDIDDFVPREQAKRMSLASVYAITAAKMAVQDSGLEITEANHDAIDISLGTACPDLDMIGRSVIRRYRKGLQAAHPFMPPVAIPSAPAGNVSIALGVRGETMTISTACSSSLNAIGHAFRKIRSGDSRVILAGGTDIGVQVDVIASFSIAGGLSTKNGDPSSACRPFEANRDGHVLSDAAGILVLEDYENARQRRARVYAEIVGYGVSSDGHSMSEVCADERSAAKCIERAIRDAGRDPEQVDFYCAHGTAARTTDARETRMLKRALGHHAYRVPVSGIKSMTGHPFGAAGVMQASVCALALRTQVVPPTMNYEDPDPECDLDYVPNEARESRVGTAMTYSLGMGNNAALLMATC